VGVFESEDWWIGAVVDVTFGMEWSCDFEVARSEVVDSFQNAVGKVM